MFGEFFQQDNGNKMQKSENSFIALLIVKNFIEPVFYQDIEVTEENAYSILLDFINKRKHLPVHLYQEALVAMAAKQNYCINKIRNFLHETFVENLQPNYGSEFKY